MAQIIWPLLWLLINIQAACILWRYAHNDSLNRQRLAQLLTQTERELDLFTRVYEDSARRMEQVERERRLRWGAVAEQLIVLRQSRGWVGSGKIVIAQLFLTETDVEFLRGRPGLAQVMGEAAGAVASRWFYSAVVNPA